jgi:hypothetical protein
MLPLDKTIYNRIGVGVDLEECPDKPRRCKCGVCDVCGYAKHMAIHSKCLDGRPWGHEFKAEECING